MQMRTPMFVCVCIEEACIVAVDVCFGYGYVMVLLERVGSWLVPFLSDLQGF